MIVPASRARSRGWRWLEGDMAVGRRTAAIIGLFCGSPRWLNAWARSPGSGRRGLGGQAPPQFVREPRRALAQRLFVDDEGVTGDQRACILRQLGLDVAPVEVEPVRTMLDTEDFEQRAQQPLVEAEGFEGPS